MSIMRLLLFLFICITLFTIPSHANTLTRLRDTITSHHHHHDKSHQQTHDKHHIQHGHEGHHQQKHHVATTHHDKHENQHHNKHHVDTKHHDKHENKHHVSTKHHVDTKHHNKHENKHHIDTKHHNKHHMEHTTSHHIKQKHHHQHQTDADTEHKHHVAVKHGHHIKHAMQNKHKHQKKCENPVPMPKIHNDKKYNILIEGTCRTHEELKDVGKLIHKWVKMMASDVEYKLKHDQILMMTPNGPVEGKLARQYVSTLINTYCLRVSATEG